MTQKKIYPIIVTYYSELKDCNTFLSLLSRGSEDLRFLVYDNSPQRINKMYENAQIDYFGDGENRGVSAAYNYGCRIAEKLGYEYVLLLDEDTCFEKYFFQKLLIAIEKNKDIDVFAPPIFYQKDIPFSPSKSSLLKTRGVALITNQRYPLRKYMPVNSGTCIRICAFKKANGYNEAIKMDFADFDFFQRLARTSSHFVLIDSIAQQDFSNDETNASKLQRRYRLYLDGAIATSNRSTFLLQVIRHTLALTVRTGRVAFIFIFIKQYLFRKR